MGKEILNQNQSELFLCLASSDWIKSFYLTGGTALAAYYLDHRYSEDLDFFSEKEIDIEGLTVSLEKLRSKLPVDKIDFQKSLNRNLYFFHFKNGVIVKTEFTYFPFTRIEKGIKDNLVEIDSLLDIAVNKVFTIFQNPRARDFIDLYFIIQKEGWLFSDLVKKAHLKFDWPIDPLNLGSQLVKAKDLKDMPIMIKPLNNRGIERFFIEEAKKLAPQIFSE